MKNAYSSPALRSGIFSLILIFISAPLLAQSVQSAQSVLKTASQAESAGKSSAAKSASLKSRAAAPAHSLPAVGGAEDDYPALMIGPGDLISVAVYGDNDIPLQFQLDSGGFIIFPYVGKVKLSGMTPIQAGEKIASLSGKSHNVSVLVLESNTFYVSVLGSVSRPGKYQIRGTPSILSILAEAGGSLPGSDLGSSVILRDRLRTQVNLNQFMEGKGATAPQPYLYPGDTLIVPRGGFPSTPGDFAVITGILASLTVAVYYLNQTHIVNF